MFAALVPPQSVIDHLDDFLAPRRDADSRWRWTRPEGWHLTCAFLESVPAHAVDELLVRLGEAAAKTPSFDVRIGRALCFGSVARARVLALDVPVGADELSALSVRCRGAANRAGVVPDGARFVPHLTLARANRPVEATKWVRILDSFEGASWRADELALVESHLSDRGNRYEIVERFALS